MILKKPKSQTALYRYLFRKNNKDKRRKIIIILTKTKKKTEKLVFIHCSDDATWSIIGLQRASANGARAILSEPRGYTRVVIEVAAGHPLGALASVEGLQADRTYAGAENSRQVRRRRCGDRRLRHHQRLVHVEVEVVRTGFRPLCHFLKREKKSGGMREANEREIEREQGRCEIDASEKREERAGKM